MLMTAASGAKKFLWLIVKLAIAFGIVAYLLRNPEELFSCLREFDYLYLIPAMMVYGSHIFVTAWRWRVLTRILGLELSVGEAVSLTFQGCFFSQVMPGGAIGGDVIKMGVISRRSHSGTRMEGAFTVLMDRIIGMIALFVLALVLVPFAVPLLMRIEVPGIPLNNGIREILIIALVMLCLAGLAASCVIFFHRVLRRIAFIDALMNWGDRISGGMVARLTAATDLYARSWRTLGWLVVISLFFVHLMTAAAFALLLWGLGLHFSLFTLAVAVTIGNIAGLIPLFPGGVGARDLVIVTILAAGGVAVPDAKSAQLMYTAIILLFNLAGGIFFVCDPGRKHKAGEDKFN